MGWAASRKMMVAISVREWQLAGAAGGVALAAGFVGWLLTRKRLTADELECERRAMLVSFGRIVDGMLLDSFQIESDEGEIREMLLYQYEISGVTYECSQDISLLHEIITPGQVKVGMPCSIRYQPGSPENSLIVAERWSGLRDGLPVRWLTPSAQNNPESHVAPPGVPAGNPLPSRTGAGTILTP